MDHHFEIEWTCPKLNKFLKLRLNKFHQNSFIIVTSRTFTNIQTYEQGILQKGIFKKG